MEQISESQNQIYIFDSLYTNNHIQMLKIIYGVLPVKVQQKLAPFIKYLELQYSLQLVRSGFPNPPNDTDNPNNIMFDTIGPMIKELKPYLGPKESEQFNKLEQFYQMFHQFKHIQETLEQFEAMTGIKLSDLAAMNSNDNSVNMDLLLNLLSNEQKDMFDAFMKG
ncbi:MAG: hypothetical protein IJX86_10280 [Lachnospiraceae bacterium]|nr:hypothetical protein [Lachnospiraceae bacterium]